ncbi:MULTISPECIES: fimbrial protein [Providencia]|uniref:MrfE family protein n=1 Tax=Providencia heimbachae ATCC 35613 TaxID=1354272 RepID=A0A1B7JWV6_9GAMM|nr:fimbrial protein [Providencia heimbachae]MBP6123806.1 type 1 fimbrial protein [Providencia sp.]NIH24028.1 type 1 fimbrial protein [Providencia heimbachae]OAT52376.1 MrfE family protein [Providencia heimbachae ATCC 35613]SQH14928.1 Fimbria A protein precursor [Providencia heimbachae]
MKRTHLYRIVALCAALPLAAFAIDNWEVEGLHGQIRVNGQLTEAPCRLDMASAWQEVSLGDVPAYRLRKAGNEAEPVPFTLLFRDCIRTQGVMYDQRTDTPTWDAMQPIATVSFVAPADTHYPEMLAVKGVSGLALKVTDKQKNDIRLGSRGRPQFLEFPQGSLTYYVTPVRTPEKLSEGQFRAVMDFRVNYD